jgi:hypothetical protein
VDLYKVFIFGGSNLKHGRQGQLCVVIGWNFKELLWNHLTNWTDIWWEWWGDRPLKFCGFFLSIGNSRWPPLQDIVYIGPYGKTSELIWKDFTNCKSINCLHRDVSCQMMSPRKFRPILYMIHVWGFFFCFFCI